jgi:hypothetical protein
MSSRGPRASFSRGPPAPKLSRVRAQEVAAHAPISGEGRTARGSGLGGEGGGKHSRPRSGLIFHSKWYPTLDGSCTLEGTRCKRPRHAHTRESSVPRLSGSPRKENGKYGGGGGGGGDGGATGATGATSAARSGRRREGIIKKSRWKSTGEGGCETSTLPIAADARVSSTSPRSPARSPSLSSLSHRFRTFKSAVRFDKHEEERRCSRK